MTNKSYHDEHYPPLPITQLRAMQIWWNNVWPSLAVVAIGLILLVIAGLSLVGCQTTLMAIVQVPDASGQMATAMATETTYNPFGELSAHAALARSTDGGVVGTADTNVSKTVLGQVADTFIIAAGAAYAAHILGASTPVTAGVGGAGALAGYYLTKPTTATQAVKP